MDLRLLIFYLLIPFSVLSQGTPPLDQPFVENVSICGADRVTLHARSAYRDPQLTFIWYDEELNPIGIEIGANGVSEHITDSLIENQKFFVSVELNGRSSDPIQIQVTVEKTASVLEHSRIQLCGSVVLHGLVSPNGEPIVSYQWQKLSSKDEDEAIYQNLPGENNPDITLTESGFYRIKATMGDGCVAISKDVEVTTELVAPALPEGSSTHCYTVGDPKDDLASYKSEWYRVGVTTVEWYYSTDNGVTYTQMLSTDPSPKIPKPASIIDTDETHYYRLIVTEQNCSDQKDFEITWQAKPRGTIQHINTSTSDFFYCETYPANERTLEAISLDNVEVSWYRFLNTEFDLDFIKNLGRTSDDIEIYKKYLELIGTGNQIELDNDMGGLIVAEFTDLDNGCVDYSSNTIFADTAFPFAIFLLPPDPKIINAEFNGVCKGLTDLTLESWDKTPEAYEWLYSPISPPNNVVGNANQLLIDGINNAGNVQGWYTLEVVKNGCRNKSDEFYIIESEPIEATIETTNTQYCLGREVLLESKVKDPGYIYEWYSGTTLYAGGTSFKPTEANDYVLQIRNLFCTTTSAPVQVTRLAQPNVSFSSPPNPDDSQCKSINGTLAIPNSTTDYQWFVSPDSSSFAPIADETKPDYFINDIGFYYIRAIDANGCISLSDTLHVADVLDDKMNFDTDANICSSTDHVALWLENPREENQQVWKYSNNNTVFADAKDINHLTFYQAKENGFYKVDIKGDICTLTSPTIEVTTASVEAVPSVIEGNNEACSGSPTELSSQYSSLTSQYTWLYSVDKSDYTPIQSEKQRSVFVDPSQFPRPNPSSNKINFLLGVKEGGCATMSDPFELTAIRRPELEIRNTSNNSTEDLFVCDLANTNLSLEAFQLSTNSKLDYEWKVYDPSIENFKSLEDANEKQFDIPESGVYQCSGTVVNSSCNALSNTIEITSPPNKVNGDSTYCFGEDFTIVAHQGYLSSDTYESFDYSWFYSEDNFTFVRIDTVRSFKLSLPSGSDGLSGGYFYFLARFGSCEIQSDVWKVSEDPNSFEIDILGNNSQFKDEPFELNINTDQPTVGFAEWFPEQYLITSNGNKGIFTVPTSYEEDEITLYARVNGTENCSSVQKFSINLSDPNGLSFSKIISPNNDGLNDTFRIKGLKPSTNHLYILDSWGNKLFEVNDYDNSQLLSDQLVRSVDEGNYYYVFSLDGKVFKGSFYVKK
ncbi:T9SS type B sorting domain-containing protein [Reichenbachiella versicolor]|uniref:T9SS type B sorting domain-containing protein n=1 Tax=Reichenbachiella versicolor TaxID=1821036 RepID=UPI000D6E3FAE|nr:gliding motility-associated C-terminal domain-containing protein [Reichenbachiella versicolor]